MVISICRLADVKVARDAASGCIWSRCDASILTNRFFFLGSQLTSAHGLEAAILCASFVIYDTLHSRASFQETVMSLLPRLLAPVIMMTMMCGTAAPQSARPAGLPGPDDTWTLPNRDTMNANTVTVITAPAGGATAIFGSDMARVLDNGELRVLPVLGKGPVRNVVDILYLKAIDMGMVSGDVPEFYKLQYKIPDIGSQLRQIAKLYNNELHIIAPTSIKSICDLEGKRIVAQTDVGYYSAKVIFSRLNMHVTYDYWTDDARAIQKIID